MIGWKQWLDDQAPTRILLAKTCSASYLRMALVFLRRELPHSEIILWTEERESEEFYQHSSVAKVVLYRNLRLIPAMLKELRAFAPYLVVTESTHETTYDKMRIFAWVLLRGPGLVVDESMEVIAFGSWLSRLPPTIREVLSETFQQRLRLGLIATQVARLLTFLISLLAAPFVFLTLLGGAARIELRRRARFGRSAVNGAGDRQT